METTTLSIKRVGSFMSRNVPYVIWFKDKKLGKIFKDEDGNFTIEKTTGVLKVRELGSNLAFHKIEKEVAVLPEHINSSNRIECRVKARQNWLGILTLGIFGPIRKITITFGSK